MTTPKITMTLLIMLCSFLTRSQTFVLNGSTYIGKTKKEINKINETNNSKLFSKQKVGPITSIIYDDSLNSLTHHFVFARKFPFGPRKCFSYLVTIDSTQFKKTKADLLALCNEKISDTHAVQVSGTKKYVWLFIGSEKSNLCAFSVEKYREGRNYR